MKKLPIGIDGFEKIRDNDFYYVDKTGFISELLRNWGEVNLFTRPRRFGKTLNMSMLKCFFEIGADKTLFDGLKIAQEKELCEQYQGQFPVIFLSLKSVDGLTFEAAAAAMRTVVGNEAARFREMMMMYMCAIREVKTKLEVLNDDLAIKNQRNPIQMIKSRVKKPASIVEKLKRRGHPVSVNSIVEHLDDVAGVRVICSFVDDIYTIAEMLARQDDVNVLMVKDYIRSPKVNGYRSYHMIIEIPVFFSDRKQKIRVEVQIRTIAMDFWASLDHQMKYKKNLDDSGEISEELKECAEVIAQTDMRMLNIRRKIEEKECPDKLLRFDRD